MMMNQSCDEEDFVNNQHLCEKLFKFCFCLCFFFSESVIEVLIDAKDLEREKKEAIEEMLTQIVQAYDECNDHSRDDVERLKSFTGKLIKTYKVLLVTVREGSIVVILECPTLESLEHLWTDYLSGDLDKVAERYLVTNEMKKQLNLETTYLKTSIDKENYLNCKKALMELPNTCSGEYKQNVWEVQLHQVLHEGSSWPFISKNAQFASGAWKEVQ